VGDLQIDHDPAPVGLIGDDDEEDYGKMPDLSQRK
jgi:hypothetical protein